MASQKKISKCFSLSSKRFAEVTTMYLMWKSWNYFLLPLKESHYIGSWDWEGITSKYTRKWKISFWKNVNITTRRTSEENNLSDDPTQRWKYLRLFWEILLQFASKKARKLVFKDTSYFIILRDKMSLYKTPQPYEWRRYLMKKIWWHCGPMSMINIRNF